MPSVSQTVPNYVLGISEQPDQLKLPGQVSDLVNAYPDVTSGLVKRPGTHLLGNMTNAQDDGKWFDIYRDDVEQYVVQVAPGGQVRVWCLVDRNLTSAGEQVAVNFAGTTDDHYDYLVHTDPDDIQALTVNDVTFILNRDKDTAMAATTSAAAVNEAWVSLLQIAYNKTYKFDLLNSSGTVVKACDSALTSADTSAEVQASTILSELRSDAAGTHGGITFTCRVIGNGLHITADAPFGITTSEAQLMNVFSSEVEDVSRLPYQCHHGYKLKITNSQSSDDDYWLEFKGNNNADGEGHWEESVAPGIRTTIDNTTMPVQLVRQANGNFEVSRVDWKTREVGDDTSVPRASFLPQLENGAEGDGKKINKMLFFRNRLCLLSNENIIMSRPGEFLNFWANTALTASPVDPIDLSAASTTPAVLFDGIEINTGLILFSRTQQFILATDADVLTAETAKINVLSSYEFDVDTRPIPIGSTIGFVNDTGTFSRFFEMTEITREGEPVILEQSKVISTSFPSGLRSIGDSRENSLVLFASDTLSPTLWCYKYFNRGDQRVQSAWFKWTMSGDVVHVCIFKDNVFLVLRNLEPTSSNPLANTYSLHRLNLHETEATVPVEDTNKAIKIFLDHKITVPKADVTFDTNTRKSTFARPMYPYGTFVVYTLEDGNNTGNAVYPTQDGTNLVVDGDWTDVDLVVGFEYTMSVKMPNIYYTYQDGDSYRSDVHASLVIHRVKLDFGPVGVYDVTIKRKGRDDFTKKCSSVLVDQYQLDDTKIALTSQQSIPIYDRNINCTIELISKHPSPTSLYGMSWEGDMTERFYRRA